jgi:hypothetical protein
MIAGPAGESLPLAGQAGIKGLPHEVGRERLDGHVDRAGGSQVGQQVVVVGASRGQAWFLVSRRQLGVSSLRFVHSDLVILGSARPGAMSH